MFSLEKWMILSPLQKLSKNVGGLGKIIVATGFEWLAKVQNITQPGHTGGHQHYSFYCFAICHAAKNATSKWPFPSWS